MTGPERGILLLCCRLSDGLQPLTLAQYRKLGELVRKHGAPEDPDRDLTAADLTETGLGAAETERILRLLDRDALLDRSLAEWKRKKISVCTVKSPEYPQRLLKKLADDAPPVLFLRGDVSLLNRDGIALVGSRDLTLQGELIAEQVGRMAARKGLVLISGNARGADQAAQKACLQAGGCVMSFVADRLMKQIPQNRVLYLSEESPERSFSALRALRRNRLIHAAGSSTFVAQVTEGSGGTWSGAVKNLQAGWSPLYVHADGSSGAKALTERGAKPVTLHQLTEE